MKIDKVSLLGMTLERWVHKSCVADIGTEGDWATIYSIESKERGKGHGTELLMEMKKHYEAEGKKFGSSVALTDTMRHLLIKLNIKEHV